MPAQSVHQAPYHDFDVALACACCQLPTTTGRSCLWQPCANPFRNFVGRVSGIPGAAKRTDLSIIRMDALANLVGGCRLGRATITSSTMTSSYAFVGSSFSLYLTRASAALDCVRVGLMT